VAGAGRSIHRKNAMNFTLISAAVAGAIGFGAAWQIQTARIEHAENHRIEIAREQEREISRLESKRSLEYIDAQNRARQRESKLRADVATANAAVDSLRDSITSYVQATRSNPDACAVRTDAIGQLLAECSKVYSEMAGIADRLNSDRVMLMDAWPK